MKKYIGTKEVQAVPMHADEAVQKGYKVGEHQHEDGYEVVYPDGYKSWSPKEVFEKYYQPNETKLDKVMYEGMLLGNKVCHLAEYFETDEFKNLDEEIQELLRCKYEQMDGYMKILIKIADILRAIK